MTDFNKKVQEYIDSFTPKWCKEDLIAVLEDVGVEGTDENLAKFMEENSSMRGFRECLIEDWFERMRWLVDKEIYKED